MKENCKNHWPFLILGFILIGCATGRNFNISELENLKIGDSREQVRQVFGEPYAIMGGWGNINGHCDIDFKDSFWGSREDSGSREEIMTILGRNTIWEYMYQSPKWLTLLQKDFKRVYLVFDDQGILKDCIYSFRNKNYIKNVNLQHAQSNSKVVWVYTGIGDEYYHASKSCSVLKANIIKARINNTVEYYIKVDLMTAIQDHLPCPQCKPPVLKADSLSISPK